jgi:predicted nucleotidyltransferase
MEFASLVDDQLPPPLRPVVLALLERKRAGEELASGPRIPEINAFLDGELCRFRELSIPRGPAPDWDALDRVFRESLREVWGD